MQSSYLRMFRNLKKIPTIRNINQARKFINNQKLNISLKRSSYKNASKYGIAFGLVGVETARTHYKTVCYI